MSQLSGHARFVSARFGVVLSRLGSVAMALSLTRRSSRLTVLAERLMVRPIDRML